MNRPGELVGRGGLLATRGKDFGLGRLWISIRRAAFARRGVLLAYLAPALLSGLAVQAWFESGTAIAFGDLAPPVAPEAAYTSHWSHLTAGEGAPTYDIVGLPYAAWLDAWTALGGGEELAQRLWLTALFAGSAAAVVFLAFGFRASPLAAGTAGLLASFSAYRLITGPDPIPMAAMLVAALLGGFVLRVALRPDRRTSVLWFAVASMGLGYVMSNPPQVVLVVLWVAVCLLIALVARPRAAPRIVAFLAKAGPLALLLNAWWIVPAWLTITGARFGDRFAAAGVDEWSWTHERAGLVNALTLNTTWAWRYPEYFPYADRLEDLPFAPLKFALPILAVLGVALARRTDRRIALGLAVSALVALWLATGLRGPVPSANRWLYEEVPGFWLFRDPTKLLLLVLLPSAVLAGVAVSRLFGSETRGRGLKLVGVGLVAGALVFVHPLFTGEVIADERPLLPSAHVEVPDTWAQAAAAVNAEPGTGKVLVLPRSDYYQVPTRWGYYGVPFTRTMIRRPVLEAQAGGYFRPAKGVAVLEESVETDLAAGRVAGVSQKLAALGVRYVLVRGDIDLEFPDRDFIRPQTLARSLEQAQGVEEFRSFGPLRLYRVTSMAGGEIFAARPTFYAGSAQTLAPALGALPGTPGYVTGSKDRDSLARADVRPAQLFRFEEDRVRRLVVRNGEGTLQLRIVDPARPFASARSLSSPAPMTIATRPSGSPALLSIGNSLFSLPERSDQWLDLGLLGLQEHASIGLWRLAGTRGLDPATTGPVGDCNAVDRRSLQEVGIRSDVVTSAGVPTLRLSAEAHSSCVVLPLVREPTPSAYRIRLRYRTSEGSPARACIWQSGIDRCAPAPPLKRSQGWQTFEAAVRPDPRVTGLALFLYADGRGTPPATVTEYRGIRLERYRLVEQLPLDEPRLRSLPGSPFAQRTLAIASAPLSRPLDLSEAGPVGDCHRYDERTPTEAGLRAEIVDRALRLSARDHTACVAFEVAPFDEGARAYRVRFAYRSIRGADPRVCLWQVGPDRCAPMPVLERDSDWRVFDRTILLDPDVHALRLFLYADGGDQRTVAEYRDVHVVRGGSVAIVGRPREQPLPRIVARRVAPWKFHVRVTGAEGPFLLVTSEAYFGGWKAHAHGRDSSELRHVQVNGYANGWLVPWTGSYELTVEYGPERYARGARWLTVLAPVGLLTTWIYRRRRRLALL